MKTLIHLGIELPYFRGCIPQFLQAKKKARKKVCITLLFFQKFAPRLDLTSCISSTGIARLESSVGCQAIPHPICKNNFKFTLNFLFMKFEIFGKKRKKKNFLLIKIDKLPELLYTCFFDTRTIFNSSTRCVQLRLHKQTNSEKIRFDRKGE